MKPYEEKPTWVPHISGRPWLSIQPIAVQFVAIIRSSANSPEQSGSPQLNLRLLGLLIHHLVGTEAAVDKDPPRRSVECSGLGETVLGRDISIGVSTEIRIAVVRNLLRRRVVRADAAQVMIVVFVVQGTQIRHRIGEQEGIGPAITVQTASSNLVPGQTTGSIRHQPIVQGTRVSASQTKMLKLQRSMRNGSSQWGSGSGSLGNLQGSSALLGGHCAFLKRIANV